MKNKCCKQEHCQQDVAIIGMAGRFPGARNVDEFLQNLRSGKDCTSDVPKIRIQETGIPDLDYYVGGYLDDIDKFDHELFGISKAEAINMDPHQRILMEVVYEAIENAGYDFKQLSGSKTAVYFSCPDFDYQKFIVDADPTSITGLAKGITPGRISRFFNLIGPSYLIDTTCSSSLVSIAMGQAALMNREIDLVIVCAVNLVIVPPVKKEGQSVGIASPDGKARAFSNKANGTSSGEGAGCVILKPLKSAIHDKDNIQAVVRAAAINQDAGRSSYLTAPSQIAQTEVVKQCWAKAGVDPRTVTYIQCHGTGTKIGDPIEIEALTKAFASHTDQKAFCAVSSIKSNIGHTNTAAGISSFISVVLSLKNKELFPTLHFDEPNALIDFANSAVFVNDKLTPWRNESNPLRAGVSSFGLGGTNCHVLLEEAPTKPNLTPSEAPLLFPFSANDSKGLDEIMTNVLKYLPTAGATLIEISNTLCRGRHHYTFRKALVANSQEELMIGIDRSLTGGQKNETSRKRPVKVVSLYSDLKRISPDFIQQLTKNFPTLKTIVEQSNQLVDLDSQNSFIRSFLFQYGATLELSRNGITAKVALGPERCEILIDAISGRFGFDESVRKLKNNKSASEAINAENLERFIKKELLTHDLVFLNFCSAREKPTQLAEISSSYDAVKFISAYDYFDQNKIIELVQELYLAGVEIEWNSLFRDVVILKAELPGYSFKKDKCWVPIDTVDTPADELCYELIWARQDLKPHKQEILSQTLLIVGPPGERIEQLRRDFEASGNQCLLIVLGEQFKVIAQDMAVVDPNDSAGFQQLWNWLDDHNLQLNGVVKLEDAENTPGTVDTNDLICNFTFDWHLLKYLYPSFDNSRGFQFSRIRIVSEKAEEAKTANAVSESLIAIDRCLQVDFPIVKVTHVIADRRVDSTNLSKHAIDEISSPGHVRFTYFNAEGRHIQKINKLYFTAAAATESFDMNSKVYVIIGGAGGIGQEIAKCIAKEVAECSIVIIGRSNPNDARIQREIVTPFSNSLANIRYLQADVTDSAQVSAAFDVIRQIHTSVDVVFHCAGEAGKWVPLAKKDASDFRSVLGPKVNGTAAIWRQCKALGVKKLILFSSLNAIVPHRHSLEYALANAFMDSFATQYSNEDLKVISVNWPVWKEVGKQMNELHLIDNPILKKISNRSAIQVLKMLIARGKEHVLVADVNLDRFKVNPFFSVESGSVKNPVITKQPVTLRKPDSILETLLAIVSDVLQASNLTGEDDFFSLGGNSLNVIPVINRVEAETGVLLDLECILEHTSLKELSVFIEQATADKKHQRVSMTV
jgi:3-oxoacyl-(acyl-carrier-protein) synthase/NADP-dependent 3-hydroxy acid dehydrogenase YdfG